MAGALRVGDKVEVRLRYDERWARGFEVVSVDDDGVRLRRLSDGEVLPVPIPIEEVRKEHKHSSMWWI